MKALLGKISPVIEKVKTKIVGLLPQKLKDKIASSSKKEFSQRQKFIFLSLVSLIIAAIILGRALDTVLPKKIVQKDPKIEEAEKHKKEEEEKAKEKEAEESFIVQYKPMQVQTLDKKTLTISVVLQCKNKPCESYFEHRSGFVMDQIVINVAYSKDLLTEAGKDKLKEHVLESLRQSEVGKEILAIHFVEFVIQ